ncbi:hypothetical protein, partial [uncultured Azohydromonas sp.]|uniref:hypothetical protein n=1 Tax=uncultured Azohydromonas sp. TaxID=487342 RepID=UPI002603A3D3
PPVPAAGSVAPAPATADSTATASPAAQRLVAALEPALARAQALSRVQVEPQAGGAVNNVFNVSVTLQGGPGAQAPDPLALEQALSELLYAAARRHGLEI